MSRDRTVEFVGDEEEMQQRPQSSSVGQDSTLTSGTTGWSGSTSKTDITRTSKEEHELSTFLEPKVAGTSLRSDPTASTSTSIRSTTNNTTHDNSREQQEDKDNGSSDNSPTGGSARSPVKKEVEPSCSPRLHLEAIKLYTPSPHLDWESLSLEHNRLLYFKDPQVRSEFRRFMNRDFTLMCFAFLYGCGSIMLPLTKQIEVGEYLPTVLAPGMINWLWGSIDTVLHLKFPNREPFVTMRFVVQFLITMTCCLVTGFTTFVGYYSMCHTSYDVFGEGLGFPGRPDPLITDDRIRTYCKDIIIPYTIFTLTVVMIPTPFGPFLCAFFMLWEIAIECLARVYFPHSPPETGTEIASKVIITLLCTIASLSLVVLRQYQMMAHFRQTIQMQIETQKAKKREAEVEQLLISMLHPLVLNATAAKRSFRSTPGLASVFYSDMVNFTAWSSRRNPRQIAAMLNAICKDMDITAVRYRVEKIKTIGDAYWAVCGAPEPVDRHATILCDFATAVLDIFDKHNRRHPEWNQIKVRVAVHTGVTEGGVLGTQQLSYEVYGNTNIIAEFCEKAGKEMYVTISEDCLDALIQENEDFSKALVAPLEKTVYDPEKRRPLALYTLQRRTIAEHLTDDPHEVMHSQSTDDLDLILLQPPSASSSNSVLSDEADNLKARQMRLKFLRERRERQEESTDRFARDDLSPEVLTERYSTRKYNWFLYEYKDKTAEKEFKAFLETKQAQLRLCTRLFTLAAPLVILFVVLFVNGGSIPFNSGVFFVITAVICLTDIVLCIFALADCQAVSPVIQAVLHHVAGVTFLVSCGLVDGGEGIPTNDITYVHTIVTMLVSMGNIAVVPSLFLFVFNVSVYMPLTMYLIWDVMLLGSSLIFLLLGGVQILFSVVLTEKHFRQQFLERRLMEYYRARQKDRIAEQQALLASIVPHHVVPELMAWLDAGMLIEKTIVKDYRNMCVAFVRIDIAAVDDPSIHGDHLMIAHQYIDKLLKRLNAIDKIKTIGEVVMLAGSFKGKCSLETAADQILFAIYCIVSAVSKEGISVQAGAHVGEIVGAVLGVNRLCFDIFGDAVNVASRVMMCHSTATGTVSEITPHRQGQQHADTSLEESPQSVASSSGPPYASGNSLFSTSSVASEHMSESSYRIHVSHVFIRALQNVELRSPSPDYLDVLDRDDDQNQTNTDSTELEDKGSVVPPSNEPLPEMRFSLCKSVHFSAKRKVAAKGIPQGVDVHVVESIEVDRLLYEGLGDSRSSYGGSFGGSFGSLMNLNLSLRGTGRERSHSRSPPPQGLSPRRFPDTASTSGSDASPLESHSSDLLVGLEKVDPPPRRPHANPRSTSQSVSHSRSRSNSGSGLGSDPNPLIP